MYRVIIVDDDAWALKDIQACFPFARYGFELAGAYLDAESAEAAFRQLLPDLVITDIKMGRQSGLDLLRVCKAVYSDCLVVVLSGYDHFDYAQQALNEDAFHYMLKPVDAEQAANVLRRAYAALVARDSEKKSLPQESADIFTQIIAYVEQHPSPSLSLEELAGRFKFNRTYISELFPKRVGMTFTQYKQKLYLQRAKRQLMIPGQTIQETAEALGFDNERYFCRIFKRMTGLTPQQYRARRRGDIDGRTPDRNSQYDKERDLDV